MRPALVRFALLSLLSGLVVTALAFVAADQLARARSLDNARTQAVQFTNRLAAPLIDAEVRTGTPAGVAQLTEVMTSRMRDGSVQHLRIWDESGRILWSEHPELIGRTVDLSEEVVALFGTREARAELTDLTGVQNSDEQGRALEVYVGAFGSDGQPIVVEIYLPTEPMEDDANAILRGVLPLILGSVALVLLAVLPLALSLGRRVEWALSERGVMMRHALQASELERRRVAEDLHHGVVQELSGLGYTLPVAARHLEPGGDVDTARSLLQVATDLVQRNVQALRSLMTDIYPPDLHGERLGEAVQQVVRTAAHDAGLRAEVRVQEDLDLPLPSARLAYRIIREGVRNVVKHAEAKVVLVDLAAEGAEVVVSVADDGRGPGELPGHSPEGHLGLRLLNDTVQDVGGRLDIRPRDEGGTVLVVRFPVAAAGT
ncbi:sensor histidine kinase [Knoellia sinensis]|uniref:sensor histidine kinase n=1 Tax=Knoellia sinensis TaxID=136100 RepID=UPI000AF23149|nr:ATP-binding protein [Knoellia sinensis]